MIGQLVSYAIALIGVAATFRVSWFASVLIVLMVLALQSRQIFIGYVPLQFPGFDDQVKGVMLGGMSEDAASAQVAQGETFRAVFTTVIAAVVTTIIVLVGYRVGSPEAWNHWIGSFLGHAALWLVGLGLLMVILPFVLIGYGLYTKSIKKG